MVFDPFTDDALYNNRSEYKIGQELSHLSLAELEEHVIALKREITRIDEMIIQKKQTQAAAHSLFKNGRS
jgi:uncharacterized small protein (DUF1192 family)